MEIEAAKMIGAGLAAIALAGVGVGIGNVFATTIATIGPQPLHSGPGVGHDVDRLRPGGSHWPVCPPDRLHGALRLSRSDRRAMFVPEPSGSCPSKSRERAMRKHPSVPADIGKQRSGAPRPLEHVMEAVDAPA